MYLLPSVTENENKNLISQLSFWWHTALITEALERLFSLTPSYKTTTVLGLLYLNSPDQWYTNVFQQSPLKKKDARMNSLFYTLTEYKLNYTITGRQNKTIKRVSL